jgi:hypothetical protein
MLRASHPFNNRNIYRHTVIICTALNICIGIYLCHWYARECVVWERCMSFQFQCATSRKVASSFSDEVAGLSTYLIYSAAVWPWVRLTL